MSSLRLVGLCVATTSTRVPGSTYPATPMTSLTRTDTARLPVGMIGGRPLPASFDASLPGRMGSFRTHRRNQAAAEDRRGILERAFGHRARRPVDGLQIVAAQLAAEREIRVRDDDAFRVGTVTVLTGTFWR